MWDFLTFRRFITLDLLIVFYYIGAIAVPVLLWRLLHYLVAKFYGCFFSDGSCVADDV